MRIVFQSLQPHNTFSHYKSNLTQHTHLTTPSQHRVPKTLTSPKSVQTKNPKSTHSLHHFLSRIRSDRKMIQLLFTAIFAEMILILTLLFKTPFRKLIILTLDRVKRGSGPLVAKSVSATLFLVLMSTVYSITNIQSRSVETGGLLNPTDQVLMAKHLLEASLMGFILFLGLMIDRLHHYIRELRQLRKTMEATKKQNRAFEEIKNGNSSESVAVAEEIETLKKKIELLESELEKKSEDTKAAEAAVGALKKQSDELLMEYDRLLEDNQNLRNQLQSLGSEAK